MVTITVTLSITVLGETIKTRLNIIPYLLSLQKTRFAHLIMGEKKEVKGNSGVFADKGARGVEGSKGGGTYMLLVGRS